jgi:hypothetical protein
MPDTPLRFLLLRDSVGIFHQLWCWCSAENIYLSLSLGFRAEPPNRINKGWPMLISVICGPLAVVALVFAFRAKRIERLSSDRFPHVSPHGFKRWQTLSLRSVDIFLWSTLGLLLFGILAHTVLLRYLPTYTTHTDSMSIWRILNITEIALLLVGLTASAWCRVRAWRLQRALDIKLPPKPHSIRVNCPNCSRRLFGATSDMVGDLAICKSCKTEFEIRI